MGIISMDDHSLSITSGEKYIFYNILSDTGGSHDSRGIIVPGGDIIGAYLEGSVIDHPLITVNDSIYYPSGQYIIPHVPVEVAGYVHRGYDANTNLSVNGVQLAIGQVFPAETKILIKINNWGAIHVGLRILSSGGD